jgi:MFS family permease
MGCISTVTGTLIALIVPAQRQGAGISYFSLSTILGMAAGPCLGVFLLGRVPFSCIFLLCGALAAVCLAFSFALTASVPARKRAGAGSLSLSEYIDYRTLPISLVMLLVAQAYGSVQAFMAAYAGELGLMHAAGVFFLIYACAVCLSRPFTGRLVDRLGENSVIYPSLAVLTGGLLLLGTTNSAWGFLLAAALIGAGFGNFQSSSQIIAIKIVPPSRFAQATSTFFILLDLGIGVGPYLFGNFIALAGYHGLFTSLAMCTLASMPLYYFLHGRKAGRRRAAKNRRGSTLE